MFLEATHVDPELVVLLDKEQNKDLVALVENVKWEVVKFLNLANASEQVLAPRLV